MRLLNQQISGRRTIGANTMLLYDFITSAYAYSCSSSAFSFSDYWLPHAPSILRSFDLFLFVWQNTPDVIRRARANTLSSLGAKTAAIRAAPKATCQIKLRRTQKAMNNSFIMHWLRESSPLVADESQEIALNFPWSHHSWFNPSTMTIKL